MTRTIDLNYQPRNWQSLVHTQRKRFTVVAVHRRGGKSEVAIMELINAALNFKQDLGLFFYVAPLLKQAKIIAWQRIKQRCAPLVAARLCEINESELFVRFTHNGATIRIYGADNPDAMRGVRLDGVVVDEVAQVKPETWEDILQPALADRKGWALFIGTPNGLNLFSDLFFKALDGREGWHAARFTVYDTNALDPEEVSRIKVDSSEQSFAREMLCDFSATGDDQLLSLSEIEEAARREMQPADIRFAPLILGVDPARFGGDRSVIVPRRGLQMMKPRVYRGIDNMALADRVAEAIDEYKPAAVFIDAGNGSGVIDRLRQLRHRVSEVPFGGAASDARYANRRAEMWFKLRDWVRAGGCLVNDLSLKQDLAAPTYRFNASDRIQLESKDDIKARGLPSPDLGDALALTFAAPVRESAHGLQERAQVDYAIFQ
jgi:hypothetical protein